MVAHFTMRTHGVNQACLFVEGIWLHRESHQILFFEKDRVYIIRAQREMSNHKNHASSSPNIRSNKVARFDLERFYVSNKKSVDLWSPQRPH